MTNSKESLIFNFNTIEKCGKYCQPFRHNDDLYWKNAGGIPIRESFVDDTIGDSTNYASISITDLMGFDDDYKDHCYKFNVSLYLDNEECTDLYDTIEEAIDDYNHCCEILYSNCVLETC